MLSNGVQVDNKLLTFKVCQSFLLTSAFGNADIIADAKSKIIVSRLQFFADEIFSNPSKVQNYQNKTGKTPIPKQILAYYVFQGILKIFSNIYALFFIFSKL